MGKRGRGSGGGARRGQEDKGNEGDREENTLMNIYDRVVFSCSFSLPLFALCCVTCED